MTELNSAGPIEIKWVSPMAFSIGDTTKMGEYTSQGIAQQVKVPKKHDFEPLGNCLSTPYYKGRVPDPIDFSKFGRPELLHLSFRALFQYFDTHGSLPELNNLESCKEIVETARTEHTKGKADKDSWIQNCQDFDENVVMNVARWARSEISPMCAFLGGVVAQEVVKYTGKYTPISQWLWFDFFETVAAIGEPDRTPMGTRYDDQVAIYGREIQKKLSDLNVFMIGAGALGCEFLKDFALMGISTNAGSVTVTDNDNIEVSNLNRQFLFRKEDVSTPKSTTAGRVINGMNKQFKCNAMQNLVSQETEDTFDNEFWMKQDFVINAVDNVKARKFIDAKCTWYGKNLIDSGTLGTKAHVQLIVPHVTSCYNDTQDPPEDSVPMCTLHNFPAMIEHCIEWGRDHFTGYFTAIIKDAQQLIENPQSYFIELKKEGNSTLQLEKVY
jgi:ubiquitin-activating enzyme E1